MTGESLAGRGVLLYQADTVVFWTDTDTAVFRTDTDTAVFRCSARFSGRNLAFDDLISKIIVVSKNWADSSLYEELGAERIRRVVEALRRIWKGLYRTKNRIDTV